MYLVSSYWRSAMNVADMRLVNDESALEAVLDRLRAQAGGSWAQMDLAHFIVIGSYRVYEMEFNKPVRLVNSKQLKELLSL